MVLGNPTRVSPGIERDIYSAKTPRSLSHVSCWKDNVNEFCIYLITDDRP